MIAPFDYFIQQAFFRLISEFFPLFFYSLVLTLAIALGYYLILWQFNLLPKGSFPARINTAYKPIRLRQPSLRVSPVRLRQPPPRASPAPVRLAPLIRRQQKRVAPPQLRSQRLKLIRDKKKKERDEAFKGFG